MSELRVVSELSAADFAALDPARTVVFFAIGSLEWGGEGARPGDWEDYPLRLARESAAKLPAAWRAVAIAAPMLTVQAGTGAGAEIRGYVLRDYLVDFCVSLHRRGFRHFVAISASHAPRQLTAIEEAGKSLRSRYRLKFWARATRPLLMSASSALVEPARQRRSLWRYQPEPADLRVPDAARVRAEADAIVPKLIATLEGADPNRLFRSWYSLVPTNWSFFRAWALTLVFFVLMAAWFYTGVQGLFE
jgi:hypothetical protein